MIRAQQESINSLKQILSQLLEDKKKKPKAKTSSKKSKSKWKEGESSSSAHTEEEDQSSSELSKPLSEKEGNSENTSTHSKRMSKLEERLKTLANRKGLQESGVVRQYPAEWDFVLHPPMFKAPTLQALTVRGHRTIDLS